MNACKRFRALGTAAAMFIAFVAPSAATAPTHLFVTDSQQPSVLASMFTDRFLVDATINGSHYWFDLDTGTDTMILDSDTAKQLQLPFKTPREADAAEVDVGPLHARDVHFYVRSYGHGSRGPRVVGVIGAPFFRSTVVTLDYLHKAITVYPYASFEPSRAGTPARLQFHGHMPFLDVTIAGRPATMLLDTGSFETFVFSWFTKDMDIGRPVGPAQGVTIGINGSGSSSTPYRLSSLGIAGVDLRHPVVYVSSDTRPFVGPYYAAGIFGRDLQSLFAITIDWQDGKAFFRPGSAPAPSAPEPGASNTR